MCTHAHWPESSLLVHTKNVCTHMRTLACTHVHTFFVCMSSEDSGQCAHVCTLAWAFFMDAAWAFFMDAARYARMRTLARVFTARTHKECVHTKNVCTHMRTLACTHVHRFFVCMSSEDSGQCAHVCTLAWAFFMDAAWAFFMDAARYASIKFHSLIAVFVLNITINIFQSYNCDHLSHNSAQVALKTLPLFSVYILSY